MYTYVELLNSRVRFIGHADVLPQSNGGVQIVDVTNYSGSLAENMRYVTGSFVDDSTPVVTYNTDQLNELKTQLKLQINDRAGQLRSLVTTITPGQEMTYVQKGLEMQRYFADTSITASNYPWLSREATATSMSLAAVASLVQTTAAQWTYAGSLIEAARRGGVVAMEAVSSSADAYTVLNSINWPSF